MNNRFIIVIGSYNNEHWVKQNLESVLSQTYTNFKIVYYNACSTDKTYEIAKTYADKDSRINLQSTPERYLKTWFFENLEKMEPINDNDIICILDGDDFIANEEVLNYLNEVYNKTNCWVTYGGMTIWKGGDKIEEPFPQNSIPPYEVFKNKLYRRDLWRYSHMRTCRGFLWKRLNKDDLKSKYDGKYITLDDLATVYAFLEMSPPDKIFRVDQTIYILNLSETNGARGCVENKINNIGQIYEMEIRNRPPYTELSMISPCIGNEIDNSQPILRSDVGTYKKITAVFTSCGRFDLLSKTLSSFLKYNDYPIEKYVVIDNSTLPNAEMELKALFHGLNTKIIINSENIGQVSSIDKAYSEVDTEYIFHCEDDWEFFDYGFIQKSIDVLEHDKNLVNINLRIRFDGERGSMHPVGDKKHTINKTTYHEYIPNYLGAWHGFSWNPGLRRLSDYNLIKPYKNYTEESGVGITYYKMGRLSACLEKYYCKHIGQNSTTARRNE